MDEIKINEHSHIIVWEDLENRIVVNQILITDFVSVNHSCYALQLLGFRMIYDLLLDNGESNESWVLARFLLVSEKLIELMSLKFHFSSAFSCNAILLLNVTIQNKYNKNKLK